MRIIFNLKHRYVIRSKFGDKFLTSFPKLLLEAKARKITFVLSQIFGICCRCLNILYNGDDDDDDDDNDDDDDDELFFRNG